MLHPQNKRSTLFILLALLALAPGTRVLADSGQPVDLTSEYSYNGIYTDGTVYTTKGFDQVGFSYSANLLGTQVTWNNINFTIGPSNAFDVLTDVTVPLPGGQYTSLYMLASAINGSQTSQPFVVNYSDNTSDTFTQSISDWVNTLSNNPGESVAVTMPYRNYYAGNKDMTTVHVYGYQFALNSGKSVSSITLPTDRSVVLLALTLAGGSLVAAPTGLVATPGNGGVSLSWTASASATSYNINRGTASGAEAASGIAASTGTSYIDTGLTNGNTYYYTVDAVDPNGTSVASNEASAAPSLPTNVTHVLWSNPNGSLSLWTYSVSTGAFTEMAFGPFSGWTAKAVADGPDGLTLILWTSTSGQASIWNLNNSTGKFTQYGFGPYAGWTANALSVGIDNTTHVLWSNTNGALSLWNYTAATGGVTVASYGPFANWSAQSIADGPDGNTRVLWTNSNGEASIWNLNNTTAAFTQNRFGPFANWQATAISAGQDNTTHVLWNNTSSAAASLWNYNVTTGGFTQQIYGPFSGWSAASIADGSDGLTRMLWDNAAGSASIWNVDNTTGAVTNSNFGPFSGWTASAVTANNGADLVAYWPGDGNYLDIAGGNDATPFGGVTFATGKVGEAFDFDGSSGRLFVADSPSLALTHSISVTAWIKITAYPSNSGMILQRGDDRSGLDPYILYVRSDGTLGFQIQDANNDTGDITSASAIPLNTWTYVAGSLDDASGALSVYINGTLAGSTTTTVRPFATLDPSENPGLGIGNLQSATYSYYFDGLIEELKVYNNAVPAAQAPM